MPPIDQGPPPALWTPELWLPPKPAIIRHVRKEDLPPTIPLLLAVTGVTGAAPPIHGTAHPFTMSFVGYSTSNTSSISPHGSAAVGDIAILFDRACQSGATPPTSVTPTGWTGVVDHGWTDGSNSNRLVVSIRKLTSTSSVTGMNGNNGNSKQMMVFTPSKALASFSIHGSSPYYDVTNSGGGTPSVSVNAGGGTSPLIVLGSDSGRGSPTPNLDSSPALDDTNDYTDGNLKHRVGYKVYNDSPTNHSLSGNTSGPGMNGEILAGFWVECVAA